MSEHEQEVIIPPIELDVPLKRDSGKAWIVEVIKLPSVNKYLVVVQMKYKCYMSQRFHLLVRDFDELKHKLRAELAKFKMLVLSGLVQGVENVCGR